MHRFAKIALRGSEREKFNGERQKLSFRLDPPAPAAVSSSCAADVAGELVLDYSQSMGAR